MVLITQNIVNNFHETLVCTEFHENHTIISVADASTCEITNDSAESLTATPTQTLKRLDEVLNVSLVQPWTDPEGSSRLRIPDFKTIGT